MSTVADFERNRNPFYIIDSTLREGEQFANANFTTQNKIDIATRLSEFGVEYLEMSNPAASENSFTDCQQVVQANLKAKILTHIRCTLSDARRAVQTGVYGVDVLFGTSSLLRTFSHGKDFPTIIAQAVEVVQFLKAAGIAQVRFSSEDSFRSELPDLLKVYAAVSAHGVDRVGVADTVGCAAPHQVEHVVAAVKQVIPPECAIEFHGHNDVGCAVANSYAAVRAGATYIDTTLLGIGERNGITPLGAFVARMYVDNPDYVAAKYRLAQLPELDNFIAAVTNIDVPFNNCVTGFCAFTHKAGIHTNAVLNNPQTYEILSPTVFGLSRFLSIAHPLTGWHAIKHRAEQLGFTFTDAEVKSLTEKIKRLADIKKEFCLGDVDHLLRNFEKK